MTDDLEVAKESAKAVQEVAKTGRAVIEAGSDLGKFLAKALGTVPEDLVGLTFGDFLRVKRIENAERIMRKAQVRLDARGVEEQKPLDAKHLKPLLEAISEESDDALQDMWANLLANAMDPNSPVHLERVLMETLRQFEPLDASVLDVTQKLNPTRKKLFGADMIGGAVGVRIGRAVISMQRLLDLGCIDIVGQQYRVESSSFRISYLGEELLLACSPDAPSD